jgi:hypothetical protein
MGAFQGNNQPAHMMPLTADDALNAPPHTYSPNRNSNGQISSSSCQFSSCQFSSLQVFSSSLLCIISCPTILSGGNIELNCVSTQGFSGSYVSKIAMQQRCYVFYAGFEGKEVKNLDQNLSLI